MDLLAMVNARQSQTRQAKRNHAREDIPGVVAAEPGSALIQGVNLKNVPYSLVVLLLGVVP